MKKQKVFEDIKMRIAREEYLPGQWLVERDLCDTYGISRTPVREILLKLSNEGLLDLEAGKGYKVKKLSSEEIVAIFRARAAVEGYAVRLACRTNNPAFLETLKEIKKELLEVRVSEHPEQGVDLGRRLHDAIMESTDNFLLQEFYDKIRSYTILTSNYTKKRINIEEHSQEGHLKIVEALEKRDADAAEKMMWEHLQETIRMILNSYINNSAELF
jgi:DNA-binding GntR family transcriptional regulator